MTIQFGRFPFFAFLFLITVNQQALLTNAQRINWCDQKLARLHNPGLANKINWTKVHGDFCYFQMNEATAEANEIPDPNEKGPKYFFNQKTAEDWCQKYSTHMMSVRDKAEYDQGPNLFGESALIGLGLTRTGKEHGNFTWLDGTRPDFSPSTWFGTQLDLTDVRFSYWDIDGGANRNWYTGKSDARTPKMVLTVCKIDITKLPPPPPAPVYSTTEDIDIEDDLTSEMPPTPKIIDDTSKWYIWLIVALVIFGLVVGLIVGGIILHRRLISKLTAAERFAKRQEQLAKKVAKKKSLAAKNKSKAKSTKTAKSAKTAKSGKTAKTAKSGKTVSSKKKKKHEILNVEEEEAAEKPENISARNSNKPEEQEKSSPKKNSDKPTPKKSGKKSAGKKVCKIKKKKK